MSNKKRSAKKFATDEQIKMVLSSLINRYPNWPKKADGKRFDTILDKINTQPPHLEYQSSGDGEHLSIFAQNNLGISIHYQHPDWRHSVKSVLKWQRMKPTELVIPDLIQEQIENMQDITNPAEANRQNIDSRPTEERLRESLTMLKSLRS
jgi:hypothetical protein